MANGILILMLLRRRQQSTAAFRLLVHAGDIVWPALISIFAEGPRTPFFLFFFFVLAAAAYRWGLWETLGTAAAEVALLWIESFVLIHYWLGAGRSAHWRGVNRPSSKCGDVRAAASVHAVGIPAGDGTAAGISGGAAETSAGGEGGGHRNTVSGAGGSRADGHDRADFPKRCRCTGRREWWLRRRRRTASGYSWASWNGEQQGAVRISLAGIRLARRQDISGRFSRGRVLRLGRRRPVDDSCAG